MLHLRVERIHDLEEEPVVLCCELDADGCEVRKVEVFHDGRKTFADTDRSTGDTVLGEGKVPSFEEIQAQAEFLPRGIDAAYFTRVWEEALRSSRR
ncbi:DUF6881 domain-containing protein [Amycolatopsis sp. NPDC059235]|uniref:DUF6881 domain-containing protein n=1 Tax=Amycolatopsis sp. NPDC059235 TaxID=3346782 RepID=UPI00366C1124